MSDTNEIVFSRILVTGANGLVGQELVRRLAGRPEYDVLATSRDDSPRYEPASCGYAQLDITATDDVKRIFDDFAPDTVINCAAMTQVDDCENQRDRCWETNVTAVEHMAARCYATGTKLIQLSTDFVFDGSGGPYREGDRPNPINFYGKSKLAAENAVRGAGLERWAVARTVLVFGAGHNLSRTNIALWLIDRLSNGETVQVVTDQWRTPTYAPDLADGIERIVRFRKSGVFHLSGRQLVTIYEFASLVAQVFDLDASLIQPVDGTTFSQTAPRPAKTGFIVLTAETELSYRPREIRAALRHMASRMGLAVSTG